MWRGFQIIDPTHHWIVAAEKFDLSTDDVIAICTGRAGALTWARPSGADKLQGDREADLECIIYRSIEAWSTESRSYKASLLDFCIPSAYLGRVLMHT
jgi:hypothetical protein